MLLLFGLQSALVICRENRVLRATERFFDQSPQVHIIFEIRNVGFLSICLLLADVLVYDVLAVFAFLNGPQFLLQEAPKTDFRILEKYDEIIIEFLAHFNQILER